MNAMLRSKGCYSDVAGKDVNQVRTETSPKKAPALRTPRLAGPKSAQTRSAGVQAPLETYLRQINETPLLSAAEERELAYRIEDGDQEARDQMVRANLRLVVNIARSYPGKGLPLQDLIAEGNLGLMRAVEGFDASMNTRFSTYASYWIKQSIKRAVINTAKPIRIPAYMADLMIKWRRATTRLQEELGRTPTPEEIAQNLELPAKKLKIIKKAIRIYNASPQTSDTDSGLSIDELCMDENTQAPIAQMGQAEELQEVLHLLDQLDKREATVLRMRFGLNGDDPKTLKEIGESLGLTRERVRQIELEALRKMREFMEAA
jgi:RNA polymerase primary sigma factor